MSFMLNNVSLIGRLTDDAKPATAANDNTYCKFTLAVQRDKDNADFIDCVAFGKSAELIAEHNGEKGMLLGVCGRLESSSYTDKDGVKRKAVTVVVQDFTFIGRTAGTKEGA